MEKFLSVWLGPIKEVLSMINKVFCFSLVAGIGFTLGVLFVMCVARIIVG